jgi:hypothetical protein
VEPVPPHIPRPSRDLVRLRIAAARLDITPDEYAQHVENGERWCSGHEAWHPESQFYPSRTVTYCRLHMRNYMQARRRGVTYAGGRAS